MKKPSVALVAFSAVPVAVGAYTAVAGPIIFAHATLSDLPQVIGWEAGVVAIGAAALFQLDRILPRR